MNIRENSIGYWSPEMLTRLKWKDAGSTIVSAAESIISKIFMKEQRTSCSCAGRKSPENHIIPLRSRGGKGPSVSGGI